MQLVEAVDHNHSTESYHAKYLQPPLPEADDRHAQFLLSLLGCLGYIPEQGIDIYNDQQPVRQLKQTEINFLRQPAKIAPVTSYQLAQFVRKSDGDVAHKTAWRTLQRKRETQAALGYENLRYAFDPVRNFFSDYVLSEELLDVTPKVMKRFLSAKDEATRRGLGEFIIGKASQAATEPTRSVYIQLRDARLLHGLTPEDPAKVVKNKLGNFTQRQRLYPILYERIERIAS